VIRLHRSNRAEELAAQLTRVVEPPLGDPSSERAAPFRALARECIVVQRRGLERWLEMRIADAHQICAGIDFLFPRRFLRERLFAPLLGIDPDAPEPFAPARLTWEIAALLPDLVSRPAFREVARYLAAEPGPRREVALARRLAEVFDDYAIYRPERVRAWEEGADPDDWQASLWRALAARCGPEHVGRLVSRARDALARPDVDVDLLPERVCVFGLSALPRLFLTALGALARRRPVHLFVLSPSREWIGDLEPGSGHPLLVSLGRSARDLAEALEDADCGGVEERWHDALEDGGSLLHQVQSDLLALRDPGGGELPRHRIVSLDASIGIHACAGAMREAEVVRDQILAAFDEIPDLAAHDVVILTPDVATYGPLLEAAFEAVPARGLELCVADRQPCGADALAQALRSLVELARGRVTSAELMDFLARDGVRERFGIEPGDLEILRGWVERAGIRWGIDAAHRGAEGQPEIAHGTWKRGLERLVLGWAAGGEACLGEVLAARAGQGAAPELLGRFALLCETVFECCARLREPRSPAEWSAELSRALELLWTARGETGAAERRRLLGALERVAESARAAGFESRVPLDAFWPEVERALGDAAHTPTHRFLSGALTVCELQPMRSIPFRVVAIVGLADSEFPRADARPDFDALARERRRGDPSRRDEDRQLFLEALLGARDRLILTYPGLSPRDGAALPPSVVIDELLDALERGFELDGKPLERKRLVVEHPLHPFSPRYFAGEDARLFTYDARAHRAYTGLCGARADPPRFVAGALPARPAGGVRDVSLEELQDFLSHPARWFCRRRLGLWLREAEAALEEDEPLELDTLERWALGSEILAQHARGAPLDALLERAVRGGDLPPGALGAKPRADLARSVAQRLADAARHACAGAPRATSFEIELPGVRLAGALSDRVGEARFATLQFGKLGTHRELAVWVRHVVASRVLGPVESFLFGAPEGACSGVRFAPVADPDPILREWLAWLDLAEQRPLPIYRAASRAFACGAAKGLEQARAEARTAFEGDPRPGGDRADPYVELVVRGDPEPLGAEFEARSRALFAPLLAHREELE
jgi:exodeoxyribonuclease V gamma subunit